MKIQVDSQGKPIALNGKVLKAQEGGGLQVGYTVDANGKLVKASGDVVFSGFKQLIGRPKGLYFAYLFELDNTISSVSFQDLEVISNDNLFEYFCSNCENLKSISFSALKTVTNENTFISSFIECPELTSIDFSSLETVSGTDAFQESFVFCSNLTDVNFDSLESVSPYCFEGTFYGCESLETINFKSLTSVGSNSFNACFQNCPSLNSLYFPSLTTQSFLNASCFSGMFDSDTATTSGTCTVHFPSNLQSTVSGLTGYPLFGGSSGKIVLAFDLEATE